MAFAGQKLTASLLGVAVSSVESAAGTTTSGSYVETLASGTACSFTFVAPTSGEVEVINTGQLDNSSSVQTTLMSFVIRTGAVIGSGTVVFAATDDDALRHLGTNDIQMSYVRTVNGLTAGATYNIRQAFRTSGGVTATYSRKRLSVIPVP